MTEPERDLLIALAYQPDPALPEWRTWRAEVGKLAMQVQMQQRGEAPQEGGNTAPWYPGTIEAPDQAMRAHGVEAIEIAIGVLKREGLGDQAERLAKVAAWLKGG